MTKTEKQATTDIFLTYNPSHDVTEKEFQQILKVIQKHSVCYIISLENVDGKNKHLHAYVHFTKLKYRSNIPPYFLKDNVLDAFVDQPKHESKIYLKILYEYNSDHFNKYYIGYCSKDYISNETPITLFSEGTPSHQGCLSSIPLATVKADFKYYLSKKESVKAQIQARLGDTSQTQIAKTSFYDKIIKEIQKNPDLDFTKDAFKIAIKNLVVRDKKTIVGYSKFHIRECYIHYLAMYCDDTSQFDLWLNHKLNFNEEMTDSYKTNTEYLN